MASSLDWFQRAGSFSGQVMLADERFLNSLGPLGINFLLAFVDVSFARSVFPWTLCESCRLTSSYWQTLSKSWSACGFSWLQVSSPVYRPLN